LEGARDRTHPTTTATIPNNVTNSKKTSKNSRARRARGPGEYHWTIRGRSTTA
jgi:hypothetical protein